MIYSLDTRIQTAHQNFDHLAREKHIPWKAILLLGLGDRTRALWDKIELVTHSSMDKTPQNFMIWYLFHIELDELSQLAYSYSKRCA
jgi:hypothetical protein